MDKELLRRIAASLGLQIIDRGRAEVSIKDPHMQYRWEIVNWKRMHVLDWEIRVLKTSFGKLIVSYMEAGVEKIRKSCKPEEVFDIIYWIVTTRAVQNA